MLVLWDDMINEQKMVLYESYLKDFKTMYDNKRIPLTFDEYNALFRDSWYPVSTLNKHDATR